MANGPWALGGLAGYETKPKELYDGTIGRDGGPVGFYDLPAYFLFRDSTLSQVLIKGDSPYEIRYEGDGTYMLYWNELAVEEVIFTKRPEWMNMTLSDWTPIGKVILTRGDACT